KREKTIQLIDQLNRELVELIPEPPVASVTPVLIDIQVASCLDRSRADKTLDRLEEIGLKPRMVMVTLSERLWHRIILGPYYQRSAAERDMDMIAKQTTFKPIFVRHTPEVKEETAPKE
ncbi:MAG: SPOR domain-containing protein, partial [Deltaproteobacteria bacterium]|nr:SPOR domain-containing protein [Deltaproteobacteria bacterium]